MSCNEDVEQMLEPLVIGGSLLSLLYLFALSTIWIGPFLSLSILWLIDSTGMTLLLPFAFLFDA